jgi:hypothetical protein
MTSFASLGSSNLALDTTSTAFGDSSQTALLNGEILLQTSTHSAWGGAVTAQMYLPLTRSHVWQQITDYPRWVHYFPDLIRSEVISCGDGFAKGGKRLYQVAQKAFFLFTAQVEIYLQVLETSHSQTWQQVRFLMEKGNFTDFSASLKLQDYSHGTLLTYSVQATPTIPVPSALIQQAMRLDLPANMRKMRQVLCDR